ncbi:MAG: rod shape-determining protein MreC [Bacillota bacterium]|nr:rod shape-determining protein MreC [Bacillota bacterium]
MRGFFQEHTRLTIVLSTVLVLLILMVASYARHGSNSLLGNAIEKGLVFLQEPVSQAGDGLANTLRGVFQFRSILAENQELLEENEALQRELVLQSLKAEELSELQALSEGLSYVSRLESYDYLAADVVAMDASDWFSVFTINAGTDRGVKEDSTVINGDGLVGRVLSVGTDWAKVISIIDESNNISFKVYRDMSILGILSGTGAGMLEGYLLDPDASIIEGDVLITSGMEIYPEGVVIGTVTSITWDNDALLKRVEVEPGVFFRNIQKVAVLTEKSGVSVEEAAGESREPGGEDEI